MSSMKKNDKTMDKLSSLKIKGMGLDEPSAEFTFKIMEVITKEQPVYLAKQRNYWWMLSFVPVMVAICYYSITIFKLTGSIQDSWSAILNVLQPFGHSISSFFAVLKSIHIPSMFLLGFMAIIALLTVEELINKLKHKSV